MLKFNGKGVCSLTAEGKIAVIRKNSGPVECVHTENIKGEISRFLLGREKAMKQISDMREKALAEMGEEGAQIFEIYMILLEDEDYNDAVCEIITNQSVKAEYAASKIGERFAGMLEESESAYFSERASDIRAISDKVIQCMGEEEKETDTFLEKVILCTESISAEEVIMLDRSSVMAVVTEKGTESSHAAILAAGMNIPAVMGVGEGFLDVIENSDTAIIDTCTGEVFVNPDKETTAMIRKRQEERAKDEKRREELKEAESITKDGISIVINANVSCMNDVKTAKENNADGIGLVRSELLFENNTEYPSEKQQFFAYRSILEAMNGKKVVVRTFDIGADKKVRYIKTKDEENPALGLRGTRLMLAKPELLKTQMKALLRASAYGNLSVMLPMITGKNEIEEAKKIIELAKKELDCEGIRYSDNIPLGVMIETPAAAVMSDVLASCADFFSIGTNDLAQYTFALDRTNYEAARFTNTDSEAVLRLVKLVSDNAKKNNIPIEVCGEMASDAKIAEKLIKLGISVLSVSAGNILKIRETVINTTVSK